MQWKRKLEATEILVILTLDIALLTATVIGVKMALSGGWLQ